MRILHNGQCVRCAVMNVSNAERLIGWPERSLPNNSKIVRGVAGRIETVRAIHFGRLIKQTPIVFPVPGFIESILLCECGFKVRQNQGTPTVPASAIRPDHKRRRETVVGFVVLVQRQHDAFDVIFRSIAVC